MKKKFMFLCMVCIVTVMTGCGKADKLTCTNEQEFGTAKLNSEIEVTFKEGYATSTETTMVASFDSEDTANEFASNYKDNEEYKVKQDGKKVTVTQTQKVEEEEAKAEENKKEKVKSYLEEEGFKCE